MQCRRLWVNSRVRKIPWKRDRPPTPVFLGFPGGSDGKESDCNAGDLGLIPGSGRSPGGGHDNSLQYSCLENPHGQRSLAGYSPWGRKESDMAELLSTVEPQHYVEPVDICYILWVQNQNTVMPTYTFSLFYTRRLIDVGTFCLVYKLLNTNYIQYMFFLS